MPTTNRKGGGGRGATAQLRALIAEQVGLPASELEAEMVSEVIAHVTRARTGSGATALPDHWYAAIRKVVPLRGRPAVLAFDTAEMDRLLQELRRKPARHPTKSVATPNKRRRKV